MPHEERMSRETRTNRRRFVAGAAGLIAAAGTVDAAEGRWEHTDSFIKAEVESGGVPGAAVVASKNGKTEHRKLYGSYCSLTRRDEPLGVSVLHPFFSFSKLVSATVVVMAHDASLIDYDKPVQTYIPEFKGGGKDGITLRHLLSHSAGIPTANLGPVYTEDGWRAALNTVCGLQSEWEPGSRTAYHALTGLFVAAEAVRRVSSGRPWAQICCERLFDPLGAKTLTFGVPHREAPVALTPQPPVDKPQPTTLEQHFAFLGHPAGGCLGTLDDALKVLQLHLNDGMWEGQRLISSKALAEMHTVQYAAEIREARDAGKAPVHEPWGLGILLRGEGPKAGGHDWFGFRDQTSPTIFGHAGIDTFIGVGDPSTGKALVFVTTNSPKSAERTVALRNGVTNRVFEALR
jgi:CubicO group peptidase (beta-lactamase class C family)